MDTIEDSLCYVTNLPQTKMTALARLVVPIHIKVFKSEDSHPFYLKAYDGTLSKSIYSMRDSGGMPTAIADATHGSVCSLYHNYHIMRHKRDASLALDSGN